jgi:hypothetical protein
LFSWKLLEFVVWFSKVASEELWVSVVPGGGVVLLTLLFIFGSVVL